jgi:phage terminase large subunit
VSVVGRLARRRHAAAHVIEGASSHDFSQYAGNTIRFCHEVLRVPHPTERGVLIPFEPWDDGTEDCQAGILRSLDAGHKRIAVRSGHKTGKSTDLAAIALSFVSVYEGGRVLITAPTDKQVEKASWREIKMFFRRARVRIPGRVYETARTGYKGPGETEIFGFVAKSADAFSGPSGGRMVIIVDEAAGVDNEIMEAIEGAAGGGAIVILVGNPTQTTGPFYDAFHKQRAQWRIHHLDSRKAIAWQEKHGYRPGLATPEWYARCVAMWGAHDARTEVRCHGEFPSQGASQVVGRAAYLAAVARYPKHIGRDLTRFSFGLDVARMGDDKSACIGVQGLLAHPARTWSKLRSGELALEVRKYMHEMNKRHGDVEQKPIVKVDEAGVGAGVYDRLLEFDDIETVGINVSERSDNPAEYENLRAQLAFGVREFIDAGGVLPEDEQLREDVLAMRYGFAKKSGRILVESKDDIKARIGRSPDKGDALMNAVYPAIGKTGHEVKGF